MKKILVFVVAVVLLFGLAACEPDEPVTRKRTEVYVDPTLVE